MAADLRGDLLGAEVDLSRGSDTPRLVAAAAVDRASSPARRVGVRSLRQLRAREVDLREPARRGAAVDDRQRSARGRRRRGGVVAALRRTTAAGPTDGGEPRQRARFMAILGPDVECAVRADDCGGRDPAMGARCLPVASRCCSALYAAGRVRVWRNAGYGRGIRPA